MTSRLLEVLKLLAGSSNYTTVEQIAEATGAGVRTIHRDLEVLERSLSLRGVRMERRRGFGVRLIDPVPTRLMESAGHMRGPSVAESGQRPLLILLYMISCRRLDKTLRNCPCPLCQRLDGKQRHFIPGGDPAGFRFYREAEGHGGANAGG